MVDRTGELPWHGTLPGRPLRRLHLRKERGDRRGSLSRALHHSRPRQAGRDAEFRPQAARTGEGEKKERLFAGGSMSAEMTPVALERQPSIPLRPYLIAFGSWWLLAMLATSIRIPVKPWRFVLELFWWQALLLEKTFGVQSAVLARGIWLL